MKLFERIALFFELFGKVTLKEMRVPNFQEGGKEIRQEQEKRPIFLGLEGNFPQFVSETLEHPLYTYGKSLQKQNDERTVASDHF